MLSEISMTPPIAIGTMGLRSSLTSRRCATPSLMTSYLMNRSCSRAPRRRSHHSLYRRPSKSRRSRVPPSRTSSSARRKRDKRSDRPSEPAYRRCRPGPVRSCRAQLLVRDEVHHEDHPLLAVARQLDRRVIGLDQQVLHTRQRRCLHLRQILEYPLRHLARKLVVFGRTAHQDLYARVLVL